MYFQVEAQSPINLPSVSNILPPPEAGSKAKYYKIYVQIFS